MFKNDFIKVASITPRLKVGNPDYNIKEIISLLQDNQAAIAVFPELSVTAYTCNDLFFQESLLHATKTAIAFLLENNPHPGIVVVGAPLELDGVLYNCAFVIQRQTILGIVPKFYLPNTGEFYEKRWFQSGFNVVKHVQEVSYLNQTVPFGKLLFREEHDELSFGIEVCEDMWAPISPGNILSLNGARIIVNLSASNEVLGKREIRKRAILEHSRRNAGAYVYSSAGVHESSSETVFSGHNLIAQNSELIVETENFNQDSEIIYGDIDLAKIDFARRTNASYRDSMNLYRHDVQHITFSLEKSEDYTFSKKFDRTPFIPKKNILASFEKIAALQENALIKRLNHVRANHVVIGISGGLDSTLALLIACRAFDALALDRKGIIAVTMPGLHTSKKTKINADNLMKHLQVTALDIDINQHVKDHFSLIGHDGVTEDITYENTQARARTMILMNLANTYGGLVLGTGDLSEMALGWCTYNGDQMSMYGINVGIPKTLVRFMITEYANHKFISAVQDTLYDIVATPITPELTSNQKTEEAIGKYEINDFIIHRVLRYGDTADRIQWLLPMVFDLTTKETTHYVSQFFRRFYSQQFKRQATPDGPKILDISVNPRGDLRLPSDIDY
ncbi:NAD(+) synthase [Candidatus Xianfuyuplasma coldseepsis]|uniref:Glutamine-dependent NAD(+) synthetase n=1 Tax=Candidatus Xianfuyuplasma coldseepsis TaxID=2782163 RepID=A0A7L7KTX7_9MOLU|nr:NAD(+) synthase [Xianfuyuplasma coldseepsis]QMS85706.1 NAD(+) synthase [Xianfuyuplasma coldseepsis]